jgi:cell division septation protein DedD
MVEKKDDKKEKDPFSDSSEIFESIFKEATQEIAKETGKAVAQPGLKPKPKPEVKPRPDVKPKAPTKLVLESKEEPQPKKEEPQVRPRGEQQPRLQPPIFKPRQEPIRKPITRTAGPDEEETPAPLLSTHRLVRGRVQEQKPREEPIGKVKRPKPPRKKRKGSPVLKIVLLLVLLAVGVGGASVYFGVVDLSDYIGWLLPTKKEAPKVAASKPSPAHPAAKPPQKPAPKAAQSSPPGARTAEAPKQPARPQPPQPPQAPPKPAGSVPQPQPPHPPSPPAVARAETPAPAVQPPVKVEPQPTPVQPPARGRPLAPPPPVQPQVKSEPKAPPAPVQPPAAPKKEESLRAALQPKVAANSKTVTTVIGSVGAYPYSVYLGSFRNMDYLKRALSIYESEGFPPYWVKVELGEKGTWYRVFTGHFKSAQEAETFIQQKRIKDGEVKETRYTNLVGTFGTKQAGEEKALALAKMGLSAYMIPAADGQVRLYCGAFLTKEAAEKNQAELNSRGIRNEIVER